MMSTKRQLWGQALGLLTLRVGFGAMMLFGHGIGKIDRLGASPVKFADPLGLGATTSLVLAIGAEVGAAGLLIVGLGTRLAAVPFVITMLVAAFIVHGADPWAKKELAMLYACAGVALMCMGGGQLSVDAYLERWWRGRRAET